MRVSHFVLIVFAFTIAASCNAPKNGEKVEDNKEVNSPKKKLNIVSTNGTLSEVIYELGLVDQLIGVDVTSTYPKELENIPSIGHQRSMTAEGIVALQPDVVVGVKDAIKPELITQLETAGVNVMLFDHQFSPKGVIQLINAVADSLDIEEKGKELISSVQKDFDNLAHIQSVDAKVLFLYARGAGTVMAFGEDTQANDLIALSGASNAVKGYDGCKPITAEALVQANPDVVVLFESGMESLNGVEGILQVPGMAQTNAGKNKSFLAFDGLYILGFGPRSGKAILDLNAQLTQSIAKAKA